MGLNGCCGIIKYLIVLVNLIFWLVGLAIVVLSVWMLTDPTFLVSMAQSENNYYIALYIFLAIGILMVIVAFLGCCGAFKESQCMLVSFFSCLLVIIVAEVAIGTWAYLNREQLNGLVKSTVVHTVKTEYGVVDSRTYAFDAIQSQLQCCGANNPSDWSDSLWKKRKDQAENRSVLDITINNALKTFPIPKSCCIKGRRDDVCEKLSITLGGIYNPDSYTEGCTTKLIKVIEDNMPIAIGVGIAIIAIELLGLIFSIALCFAVKRNDHYKA